MKISFLRTWATGAALMLLICGCPNPETQIKEQEDPAAQSSEEYLIEDALPSETSPRK